MKEVIEQKLSQIDGVTGSVEDNWGNVEERLLDILRNDIGKMEIAPRKPWITEAMIKKMEEKTKAKTTNVKERRKSKFLNIMFHALMERFQLEPKLELTLLLIE